MGLEPGGDDARQSAAGEPHPHDRRVLEKHARELTVVQFDVDEPEALEHGAGEAHTLKAGADHLAVSGGTAEGRLRTSGNPRPRDIVGEGVLRPLEPVGDEWRLGTGSGRG